MILNWNIATNWIARLITMDIHLTLFSLPHIALTHQTGENIDTESIIKRRKKMFPAKKLFWKNHKQTEKFACAQIVPLNLCIQMDFQINILKWLKNVRVNLYGNTKIDKGTDNWIENETKNGREKKHSQIQIHIHFDYIFRYFTN